LTLHEPLGIITHLAKNSLIIGSAYSRNFSPCMVEFESSNTRGKGLISNDHFVLTPFREKEHAGIWEECSLSSVKARKPKQVNKRNMNRLVRVQACVAMIISSRPNHRSFRVPSKKCQNVVTLTIVPFPKNRVPVSRRNTQRMTRLNQDEPNFI
jgi:hypothetical protein